MSFYDVRDGCVWLHVRATPKAGRDDILVAKPDAAGKLALQVKVRAAPEDGAANAAVIQMLAKALGLPKSRLSLVKGDTSRQKTVQIVGDVADIEAALLAFSSKI